MAQVQCELAIVRATNLDVEHLPPGKLFVRYYVYAGGGRRIRIDTREVSSASDPFWDERSSLECQVGSEKLTKAICEHNVAFELRWRGDKAAVFGLRAKSRLLGTAEAVWNMSGSTDMLTERRVCFVMKKPLAEGSKPPSLAVRMGIRVRVCLLPEEEGRGDECGCGCESCGWIGTEEDMFVAAMAGSIIDAW